MARLVWLVLAAIEGAFLESSDHPRAYGNVARFIRFGLLFCKS